MDNRILFLSFSVLLLLFILIKLSDDGKTGQFWFTLKNNWFKYLVTIIFPPLGMALLREYARSMLACIIVGFIWYVTNNAIPEYIPANAPASIQFIIKALPIIAWMLIGIMFPFFHIRKSLGYLEKS